MRLPNGSSEPGALENARRGDPLLHPFLHPKRRLPPVITENSGRTVSPNNPVDLQSLKLIDFHLLRWSAQQRLFTVLGALTSMLKTSAQLRLENLALRQQLTVLRRSAPKRLKLTPADRVFWVWLRRVWSDWKSALMIVKRHAVLLWATIWTAVVYTRS